MKLVHLLNLYAANPDLTQAQRALANIDTIFYVATKPKPNLGHFHGLGKENTLILPVFNRFENPPHQRVRVKGDGGELENVEIIAGEILEGVAFMFYPEANVLFRAHIDKRCGTPAYKRVPILVYDH